MSCFVQDVGESWSEWHKLHGAKPPCPELLCSLRVEGRPKMLEEVYIIYINSVFNVSQSHQAISVLCVIVVVGLGFCDKDFCLKLSGSGIHLFAYLLHFSHSKILVTVSYIRPLPQFRTLYQMANLCESLVSP
jgi:hypothetical protein